MLVQTRQELKAWNPANGGGPFQVLIEGLLQALETLEGDASSAAEAILEQLRSADERLQVVQNRLGVDAGSIAQAWALKIVELLQNKDFDGAVRCAHVVAAGCLLPRAAPLDFSEPAEPMPVSLSENTFVELQKKIDENNRFVLGLVFALVLAGAGGTYYVGQAVGSLSSQVDGLGTRISTEANAIGDKVDALGERMDQGFANVSARVSDQTRSIEAVGSRVDRVLETVATNTARR